MCLVRNIAPVALAMWALTSCVIIPIPRFPDDPFEEKRDEILEAGNVTHNEVLEKLGPPYAVLGDDAWLYIGAKTGMHVVVGHLSGGGMANANRFFYLMVDFDDQGTVVDLELHNNLEESNYCFRNGICLRKKTDHWPLAPRELDQAAKQFEKVDGMCTVYFSRHRSTTKGYFNVNIRGRLAGISVEHGYSRWVIEPGTYIRLHIDFTPFPNPLIYIPDTAAFRQVYSDKIAFDCPPGEIRYVHFTDPAKGGPDQLMMIDEAEARVQIKKLGLLLDKFDPEKLN